MTETILNVFLTLLMVVLPIGFRIAWLAYELQYYMYFVLMYYMWCVH